MHKSMLKLVKAAARTWTSFDKPKGAMRAEFNSEVAGATPLNDDSGNGWCCSLCASALEMESGQPSNRDANRHSTRSLASRTTTDSKHVDEVFSSFDRTAHRTPAPSAALQQRFPAGPTPAPSRDLPPARSIRNVNLRTPGRSMADLSTRRDEDTDSRSGLRTRTPAAEFPSQAQSESSRWAPTPAGARATQPFGSSAYGAANAVESGSATPRERSFSRHAVVPDIRSAVTVFGFPAENTNGVMHKFQKYGEIIKRVSGSNWMDIYYAEPIQAERAITQNAAMVDGLLIGVVPLADSLKHRSATGFDDPEMSRSRADMSITSQSSMWERSRRSNRPFGRAAPPLSSIHARQPRQSLCNRFLQYIMNW